MSDRDKSRRCVWLLAAYFAVGAVALVYLAYFDGPRLDSQFVWLVLGAMSVMAEFLPVSVSRRGVRFTFSLPFLAGMAVACGPIVALMTDVVGTAAGAGVALVRQPNLVRPFWVAVNVTIALTSAAVAGSVWLWTWHALGQRSHLFLVAVLGYVAAYSLANFFLVTLLDHTLSGRRFSENVLASLQPGVQVLGLYALVSVGVGILVREGAGHWVLVMMVPIWALRLTLETKARIYDHYYGTITALSLMLQRAHPYTHGHLERVARYAEDVALRLGLPASRARLVREAAVLHDIGKIAVDEEILDCPRRLTPQEMDHVRQHAAFGSEILAPVAQFQEMTRWIRNHHERPDGTGYPDRLIDVEIPLESKIIAVADAFDAMTGGELGSDRRPYCEPRTVPEALAELRRCSGSQFDPMVVRAFSEVVMGGPR
jgi:putative nucleotidyltransferase with HDIG domain